MVTVAIIAGVILVWSAFSRPLDRRGITSALVFTVAGFVAGAYVLGLLDVTLESAVAERFTEVTLVLLLFSDAARLDLGALRHELGWPSRLLLVGLPLTMLAGFGVGVLAFPGMALASVFLLSTMLCSTDAALGQRVVTDTSVPARVRQALDVESGLNDGLAVPFFLVALDLANAELTTGITWAVVKQRGGTDRVGAPGRRGRRRAGRPAPAGRRQARLDRQRVAADPPARRRAVWPSPSHWGSAAASSSPPSWAAWRSAASPGSRARSRRCSPRRRVVCSRP